MADYIIPEGYKETSLGVVPEEWEVKQLGDISNIFSGTTPSRENELFFNGGVIPWVKTTDLNNGYLTDTEERITEFALKSTTLKIFPKGTVLVAMYGGFNQIGRTAILGVNATINQALSALVPNNEKIAEYFLLNWLLFKVNKWRRYAASSRKDPNITKNDVLRFPIFVPPLAEQRKIIEVLSICDKVIEKQIQLIEKIELRKKGLMQQLLTGKKRLPGFGGEWKNIAIKDFAIEVSLKNNRNENWEVLSCTKYDGLVPSLQYFGRQVFSKDITQYKIVPQYCFAYATNHIEEGSIGYQSIYKNSLISPMYTVFKTDSNMIDDIFLYKLLKSHRAIYLYNVMMEGSIDRRGGLRWDNFSTIKFLLPDIKEQSAIADILVSCDNEILLAKQKLNKFRQQKKGLMQVLLTGKKRVNI
ncbi:restriction endonuclease subunit S [uncultured Phocaeicola sp.]|uniref:restriction endonuclease subunit S n=1 Tax=uncultured Phocaeicola sp. TaxID=990718 RepID=UPI002598AFAF|nr:restriction endonuclease subunit S [uncultured Phocaeicola sp.]